VNDSPFLHDHTQFHSPGILRSQPTVAMLYLANPQSTDSKLSPAFAVLILTYPGNCCLASQVDPCPVRQGERKSCSEIETPKRVFPTTCVIRVQAALLGTGRALLISKAATRALGDAVSMNITNQEVERCQWQAFSAVVFSVHSPKILRARQHRLRVIQVSSRILHNLVRIRSPESLLLISEISQL